MGVRFQRNIQMGYNTFKMISTKNEISEVEKHFLKQINETEKELKTKKNS
jgi:predicted DNA-binding transcriptional regulator